MKQLQLYRKRLIPDECILLKDDEIVEQNDDYIITKWKVLKPRPDFDHGTSCFLLKKGIKISKFFKEDGSLHYWYCDIVEYNFNEAGDELIVTDLLADVIINPYGKIKVVDLDELADAFDQGLITASQLSACLRQLNELLTVIDRDKFDKFQSCLDQYS